MKCQSLFSGENKKNISVCHLLKILPRVLNGKSQFYEWDYFVTCLIQSASHDTRCLQSCMTVP